MGLAHIMDANFILHATIPSVLRPPLQDDYTREQILRVAGVSERQLRIWERARLFAVRGAYAISDVKALQTLQKLKQAGLGPTRILAILQEIRMKLDHITDPLTQVTVVLENGAVQLMVDGQRMEAGTGQFLFNFDSQELARLLAFPADRKPDSDHARQQKRIAEAIQWFQRGLDLEQSGIAPEEASLAYEKAVELDPGCVGALVNLGTICFHAKQWKRAETFYRRALDSEPDYALGHFNLANLYDERGDLAQAFDHYQAALKAAPSYADAHYNIALLCQRTGQAMRAVRHWRTYLKLDPSSSWAEVARRELSKLRESAVVRPERAAP